MKRITTLLAIAIALFAGLALTSAVRADNNLPVTVNAQSNAYHTDFMALSAKRADLRLDIVRQGMDTAFTQWLQVAHPDAYRVAAAQPQGDPGTQLASRNCCQKSGQCCASNCAQCCAKGTCQMGCCTMKACETARLACCK